MIPTSLAELPRLRGLDLRRTTIESLPGWVATLPSLDKIDLRWNRVAPDDAIVGKLRERGVLVHV